MNTRFGKFDGVCVSKYQGLHYHHSDHQQELGFTSTSSGIHMSPGKYKFPAYDHVDSD